MSHGVSAKTIWFHIYKGQQIFIRLLEMMRSARSLKDFIQSESLSMRSVSAFLSSVFVSVVHILCCNVGRVVIRSDPPYWGDSHTTNVIVGVSPSTTNMSSCCDVRSQCSCRVEGLCRFSFYKLCCRLEGFGYRNLRVYFYKVLFEIVTPLFYLL